MVVGGGGRYARILDCRLENSRFFTAKSNFAAASLVLVLIIVLLIGSPNRIGKFDYEHDYEQEQEWRNA